MPAVLVEAQPGLLRIADLVAALSYALDLTGGQAAGWSVRSCRVGMRLAEVIGLDEAARHDLYYALLLKDSGCSSNAARVAQIFAADDVRAKRESKLLDWNALSWAGLATGMRVARAGESWPRRLAQTVKLGLRRQRDAREIIQLRCERGAAIARRMGFSEATAVAIGALDEHWDGSGAPDRLRGERIPLLARIVSVAQTMALFPRSWFLALRALEERSGKWYDPELVSAARQLCRDPALWRDESDRSIRARVVEMDPGEVIHADAARLDEICEAFADVIDAKSPFTYRHSRGVAEAAVAMADQFGMRGEARATIRRAALLHDIGKLGVSNRILDKAGPLTAEEWTAVREHPFQTRCILNRVPGWEVLAFIASAHHERLDGRGYHLGLRADELPRAARLIAVADVYDAMAATRPYRAGLPQLEVFRRLELEAPHALDADCVAALRAGLQARGL